MHNIWLARFELGSEKGVHSCLSCTSLLGTCDIQLHWPQLSDGQSTGHTQKHTQIHTCVVVAAAAEGMKSSSSMSESAGSLPSVTSSLSCLLGAGVAGFCTANR